MTTVHILGKGDMGPAIASIVEKVGHTVELFRSSTPTNPPTGVLAVPYSAIVETFDSLVVPTDSSVTALLRVFVQAGW